MAPQRRRQWMVQRLLDGKGWHDGSSRARDGTMAPRQQQQCTAQRLLDGEGQRDGSLLARDGASAAVMDREHNGDGRRWTAG